MDYRDLLIKYIAHVSSCEGTDFLSTPYRYTPEPLTDEEFQFLYKLSRGEEA